MDKYSPGSYDPVSGRYIPADLSKTNAEAADAANTKTADAFTVKKSDLPVVTNGVYKFSFSYLYADPNNPSNLVPGKRSPNFLVTLQTIDLTQPVTNLIVTPSLLSYGVKWDLIDRALPENRWLIDTQIYESLTGAFAGEEYLVWNGSGSAATILVSDTNSRWIRVDTRDQDFRKKSVSYGPFKATDPVVVDTDGPSNVSYVTATSGIDTSGYLGFNAYANISWPAVTGGGIRGYRIRFSNDGGATYSYVDSPGTGTTYKLAGLAIGSTYKIAVATYDEYNNVSSLYISGPDVTVTGTPSVSNFIKGGDFEFGVGVGSVATNKGLYFDSSNYWYINATNSARLKVGGSTSNYLLWDGSTFAIDGNITARGGQFSGNIFMSTTGASIYSGTIDASTGNLSGNGFALNSKGFKVANCTKSVTISAETGTITANGGSIAGWELGDNTFSKNNIILDSTGNGKIQVGASAQNSIYLGTEVSGSNTFLMWAGNNTPDANAKFRVAADGTLYAQNAVLGSGTILSGYATTTALADTDTKATNAANTATAASSTATAASSTATAAKATADAALPEVNFSKSEVIKKINNSTNGNFIDGGVLEAGTVIADNVVSSYIYGGYIDANKINAGLITGVDISISTDENSGRFRTSYLRSGPVTSNQILSTAINAVAFVSTSTSGWVTSCYPYFSGAADLGLNNYRWRRLLLDNGGYGTTSDSYIDLGFNTTRLYADGRIYANTLGTGSGSTIVKSSGGYLRVQTSSSRYKENILEINKSGYLDLLYQLKPVTYTYKEEFWPEGNRPALAGLIAEDVDTIEEFRTVVNYNEEGLPDSIAYDRMSSLLILGIKEIKDKINAIELRLDALGA